MKMKHVSAIALGVALSPLASAASIDFANNSGPFNDVLGDGSNITLTVSGATDGRGMNITDNNQGLGIDSAPGCCTIDDGALDNYNGALGQDGTWEKLTFTFSGLVSLNSLELDNFEPIANADKHAVYTTGATTINIDNNNMTNLGGSNWRYDAATDLTSFSIATPIRSDGFASFRVRGIDVTAVAEVPVPAAAWMFGSALIGLGGIARRKRS